MAAVLKEEPATSATLVGGCYRLERKIGKGSCGSVYLAKHEATGGEVAVKMEDFRDKCPLLPFESKVYRGLQGGEGIPRYIWDGQDDRRSVLVTELLGPNLEELFEFCSRKFSVKTVAMIAEQVIRRLEYIHDKRFIHRDLKPANILIGSGKKSNTLFLIDFGLSKTYVDSQTARHIPFTTNKTPTLIGTPHYASLNAHRGKSQSRRDDLESLGYLLLYLLTGSLPWKGVSADTKAQREDVMFQIKSKTPAHRMFQGFPKEFTDFLSYSRGIRFQQEPDYGYLTELFNNLIKSLGDAKDRRFDWEILKEQKLREAVSKEKSENGEDVVIGKEVVKEQAHVLQQTRPYGSSYPPAMRGRKAKINLRALGLAPSNSRKLALLSLEK